VTSVLATVFVLLLMLLWGISSYKRLVGLRIRVVNAWKHLNVQSRRSQYEDPAVEAAVADAGRSYNELARKYNAAIQVFPNNLVAAVGHFRSAELFEAAQGPDRSEPASD
jgi:hypothetical protein